MRAIRTLRVLLGITQCQLSAVSGVSLRELARIEAAQACPTMRLSIALDNAFEKILAARAVEATKEE